MKVSKKQQALWNKKNQDRSTGHTANNLEQDNLERDEYGPAAMQEWLAQQAYDKEYAKQ